MIHREIILAVTLKMDWGERIDKRAAERVNARG